MKILGKHIVFFLIAVMTLVIFSSCTGSAGLNVTKTATSSIALSPYSGPGGTSITVTGSGFVASTYGSVFFDINRKGTPDSGEPIQYLTTSRTGTFSTTLIVPSGSSAPPVPPGAYPILAAFPMGQPAQASATFTVTTTITTASPTSGQTVLFSSQTISQGPSTQTLVYTFKPTYSGSINISGSSSSSTGYIMVTNNTSGAGTGYAFGTGTTVTASLTAGNSYSIYFGNHDSSGTITATLTGTYSST